MRRIEGFLWVAKKSIRVRPLLGQGGGICITQTGMTSRKQKNKNVVLWQRHGRRHFRNTQREHTGMKLVALALTASPRQKERLKGRKQVTRVEPLRVGRTRCVSSEKSKRGMAHRTPRRKGKGSGAPNQNILGRELLPFDRRKKNLSERGERIFVGACNSKRSRDFWDRG